MSPQETKPTKITNKTNPPFCLILALLKESQYNRETSEIKKIVTCVQLILLVLRLTEEKKY